jgi:hypothetical protein
MNTNDMTFGDLVYRLVQGRDPPWNNDASKNTVPHEVYARPERLIEWAHALNPLRVHFCRCGRLHEILWQRAYVARHLYPKGPPFTVNICTTCAELRGRMSRVDRAAPPS